MNSLDVSLYLILKITTEGVVSFSILKCSSDIKINLTKKVPISDTFNEIILFNFSFTIFQCSLFRLYFVMGICFLVVYIPR